jgi:L-fuculose-phosphate aldolase
VSGTDALAALDPDHVAAVRAGVLEAATTMYERGLVEGTAGNVSGRLAADLVVVTPSSLSYRAMTLDDLVVVDLDGRTVEGERSPTSEKSLHLECYRRYPEVHGVVHCHARYSSMFAVAGRAIPAGIDEFVIYIGGDVRCAPYQQSGTDGLAHAVAEELADRSAALMANHGLVCVGKSVDDALHSALVVEHNAQIMWGAEALGGVVALPDRAVRDFTNIYAYVRGETWPRP